VISHFRNDKRVHFWDIFNEPDNLNRPAYVTFESANKADYSLMLLKKAFVWAREANPSQPISAGVWMGDWSTPEKLSPINKLMLEESDIITFHNYANLDDLKQRVQWLQRYPGERPIHLIGRHARHQFRVPEQHGGGDSKPYAQRFDDYLVARRVQS